jgi:endonuclease/exonuclease/phosphatase family metal-dependent hydrolase
VTLRLLTYNIRRGGAGREEQLIAVIRACNPDIVILQEATRPEVIHRLSAGTGLRTCASRPRESLAFMSRLPIVHHEWHHPRMSRHAFLEVVPEGDRVRVFGVHLSAVHAAWTERRRVMELRALLKSIERHQAGFHVLTGDFNTLAPGELLDIRKLPHRLRALVWLSGGRIRWKTIQVILDARYSDVFRFVHPEQPGPTFPTRNPHIRLDYLFVPASGVNRARSCHVVDHPHAKAASDHFPLFAEFEV